MTAISVEAGLIIKVLGTYQVNASQDARGCSGSEYEVVHDDQDHDSVDIGRRKGGFKLQAETTPSELLLDVLLNKMRNHRTVAKRFFNCKYPVFRAMTNK